MIDKIPFIENGEAAAEIDPCIAQILTLLQDAASMNLFLCFQHKDAEYVALQSRIQRALDRGWIVSLEEAKAEIASMLRKNDFEQIKCGNNANSTHWKMIKRYMEGFNQLLAHKALSQTAHSLSGYLSSEQLLAEAQKSLTTDDQIFDYALHLQDFLQKRYGIPFTAVIYNVLAQAREQLEQFLQVKNSDTEDDNFRDNDILTYEI